MSEVRILGGCPDCDAYQTLTEDSGVWIVGVHHDDTCPNLAAIEKRRHH
jgi:hypothetical protein